MPCRIYCVTVLVQTPTEDPDGDDMYIVQQDKPAHEIVDTQEPTVDDTALAGNAEEDDDDDSYLDLR